MASYQVHTTELAVPLLSRGAVRMQNETYKLLVPFRVHDGMTVDMSGQQEVTAR